MNQINLAEIIRQSSKVELKDKITIFKYQLRQWMNDELKEIKRQYLEQIQSLLMKNQQLKDSSNSLMVRLHNNSLLIIDQEFQLTQLREIENKQQDYKLLYKKFIAMMKIMEQEQLITNQQCNLYEQKQYDVDHTPIVYQSQIQRNISLRNSYQTIIQQQEDEINQLKQRILQLLKERKKSNKKSTLGVEELNRQNKNSSQDENLRLLDQIAKLQEQLKQSEKDISNIRRRCDHLENINKDRLDKDRLHNEELNNLNANTSPQIVLRFVNLDDSLFQSVEPWKQYQNAGFDARRSYVNQRKQQCVTQRPKSSVPQSQRHYSLSLKSPTYITSNGFI